MRFACWMVLMLVVAQGYGFGAEPERKVDPEKEKLATAVLRVKLLKAATAVEKYGYDEVSVLAVYKTDLNAVYAEPLTIAFRNTDPGVPKGESTVYLVDYQTPPQGKIWRIVASSHVENK